MIFIPSIFFPLAKIRAQTHQQTDRSYSKENEGHQQVHFTHF
jgi:hypothetical protein